MSTTAHFSKQLRANNKKQIALAGPRYTPGVDVKAPNIEIEPLMLALSALGFTEPLKKHVGRFRADLKEAIDRAPRSLARISKQDFRLLNRLDFLLNKIQQTTAKRAGSDSNRLSAGARTVQQSIRRVLETLDVEQQSASSDEAKRAIESESNRLRTLLRAVSTIVDFSDSPQFRLLSNNKLFILGDWGTGKTHFLCDIVRNRDEQNQSTLFYLAQHLATHRDPLQALCDQTGLAKNPIELVKRLDREGCSKKSRAILVIDGINEGDRRAWRTSLATISKVFQEHKHVGVVLSCRSPFDQQILTKHTRANWTLISHPGFTEIEFEAQLEYFKYYKIAAPHLPLLTPEFSRPLFLKMICETMHDLAASEKQRYMQMLAAGQKGMTRVVEDFAKKVGYKIEKDFHLKPKQCWNLIKGEATGKNHAFVGIAPLMADTLRDYVTRDECIDVIRKVTTWSDEKKCEALLHRLQVDGLLMESTRWLKEGEFEEIVQLPYQRFSDHVIARHLLAQYLNTKNEQTIRRSFVRNRPLGKIFNLENGGYSFKMPGLAAAIMLEFPERVKRFVHKDKRELVFYLPHRCRNANALRDVFFDGLYWRANDSFSKQTDRIIEFYLEQRNEWTRYDLLEILVALATRPKHPISSRRLWLYLERMTMSDRDLFWSEYLRHSHGSSVINKILEWIERTEAAMSSTSAKRFITLASLMLTTTRRSLRDRATRSLVLIGLRHPQVLFAFTLQALGFNDPYIPERLLAASYGVSMRMWADPKGRRVRKALPKFAKELFGRMLAPGATHRTAHTLMRDYALGVVALAIKVAPRSIDSTSKRYLKPPLNHVLSPFPDPTLISDTEIEKLKEAFHMDFENYTVGGLIKDRHNYDYENSAYKNVRKQILWRVGNLGYSAEKFRGADQSISSRYWNDDSPGRIDRYGKKYSWIAYFEMYGVRSDADLLPDWKADERTADCDVDPTFPSKPKEWNLSLPAIFEDGSTNYREWLRNGPTPDYSRLLVQKSIDRTRGPWVLVDGFISQTAPNDKREIFTFLRGVFVKEQKLPMLLKRFYLTEYPGNSRIPESPSTHYTYAGEIPWSPKFFLAMRTSTGKAKRCIDRAFADHDGKKWIPGIPIELPACSFSWESYHSALNEVSGTMVPTPALCEKFNLVNHAGEWDLYTKGGIRATLFRSEKRKDALFRSHSLYIRKTLLQQYLEDTDQCLVWLLWGERSLHHDALSAARDESDGDWDWHLHTHRQARMWFPELPTREAIV